MHLRCPPAALHRTAHGSAWSFPPHREPAQILCEMQSPDSPGAVAVCAFGWPSDDWSRQAGPFHCVGCAKMGLRLAREFRHLLELGYYDERGYTIAERRLRDGQHD